MIWENLIQFSALKVVSSKTFDIFIVWVVKKKKFLSNFLNYSEKLTKNSGKRVKHVNIYEIHVFKKM